MRTILTLLCTTLLFSAKAQMDVVLGANEHLRGFVNLPTGEVSLFDHSNWDLAFDNRNRTATVRANHGMGVRVHLAPAHLSYEEVQLSDTTNSQVLVNGWENWDLGALNQTINPSDPFDYGWGTYSINTHTIVGNKVFIIVSTQGKHYKLFISKLEGNLYHLRYTDFASNETQEVTVNKAAHQHHRFSHFDLDASEQLTCTMDTTAWSFLVARTGSNPGEVSLMGNGSWRFSTTEKPFISAPTDNNFDATTNHIGFQWQGSEPNSINPLVYSAKHNSTVYHFEVTKSELGTTGLVSFSHVTPSSITTTKQSELRPYPNPADASVTFHSRGPSRLFNAAGLSVWSSNEIGTIHINTKELSPGIYTLKTGDQIHKMSINHE